MNDYIPVPRSAKDDDRYPIVHGCIKMDMGDGYYAIDKANKHIVDGNNTIIVAPSMIELYMTIRACGIVKWRSKSYYTLIDDMGPYSYSSGNNAPVVHKVMSGLGVDSGYDSNDEPIVDSNGDAITAPEPMLLRIRCMLCGIIKGNAAHVPKYYGKGDTTNMEETRQYYITRCVSENEIFYRPADIRHGYNISPNKSKYLLAKSHEELIDLMAIKQPNFQHAPDNKKNVEDVELLAVGDNVRLDIPFSPVMIVSEIRSEDVVLVSWFTEGQEYREESIYTNLLKKVEKG